jgi:hypothetical protein
VPSKVVSIKTRMGEVAQAYGLSQLDGTKRCRDLNLPESILRWSMKSQG